jgi:hypothetical protein
MMHLLSPSAYEHYLYTLGITGQLYCQHTQIYAQRGLQQSVYISQDPKIFKKIPSFPRHIPDPTAKTAPVALMNKTLKPKNPLITKPERIVFISGIPEPLLS